MLIRLLKSFCGSAIFIGSPNGKTIIFQTEADWVGAYKEIGTVYLDTQTFTQKLLHRGGIYTYQFNGWEDDKTLRFCADEKGPYSC